MNTKEFYGLEEIQQYYDERANTYIFKENDEYIDTVVFNFDLNVKANIDALDIDAHNIEAYDINAYNIKAKDIDACDIKADSIDANNIIANDIIAHYIDASDIYAWNIYAFDIKANDINYYAICAAYENIKCKSIKERRHNAKHFVLDGKLEVIEDE